MIEFDSQVDTRLTQWLMLRADAGQKEMTEELIIALQSGVIQIPQIAQNTKNYAGGTNYCPNSDLKFSTLAAESMTPPADEDYECWRFFRQIKDADIDLSVSGRLKSSGHSAYAANEGADAEIPIWNRTEGAIELGSQEGASQYDVAVRLLNNHVNAGESWFVRVQLLAITADLVPDDLEMYAGIWHETVDGQSWITGGNFTLSYKIIGVKGTRTLRYKVVARTDAGNELHSEILEITDAPDILNENNFVRLFYPDTRTGGFIEFVAYREDSLLYTKIKTVRNNSSFSIDDDAETENSHVPVGGFPASTLTKQTAIAFSNGLDVGAIGGAYITNDFRIDVPRGYNFGETLDKKQFLRFGFTRPSAANRQIRLDKIWFSPSYNVWSDSSLDPQVSPSSAPVDVPLPSNPGTYEPPSGGSGGPTCVLAHVPVLKINFDKNREFVPYANIPRGDVLESGARTGRKNLVLQKITGASNVFWRVYFSNDSWIYVTRNHRFRVNRYYRSRSVEFLKTGDPVYGWTERGGEMVETEVKILFKELILVKTPVPHGTFALDGESHFYIAGFSKNGKNGVFNKNRKRDPEIGQPDLLN